MWKLLAMKKFVQLRKHTMIFVKSVGTIIFLYASPSVLSLRPTMEFFLIVMFLFADPSVHETLQNEKRKKESFRVITKSKLNFPSTIFLSMLILHDTLTDEENIPMKTIVAVAGRNLTLPCPGVNEHSLIDTLTWKTTQTIAKYINGMPMMQNQRVSKLKPWRKRRQ